MNKQQIKELALANGFKLKQQPDGTLDLNPYVYEFAAALAAEAGRAGFVAALTAEMDIGKETEAADRYAEQIRKGWVK